MPPVNVGNDVWIPAADAGVQKTHPLGLSHIVPVLGQDDDQPAAALFQGVAVFSRLLGPK